MLQGLEVDRLRICDLGDAIEEKNVLDPPTAALEADVPIGFPPDFLAGYLNVPGRNRQVALLDASADASLGLVDWHRRIWRIVDGRSAPR